MVPQGGNTGLVGGQVPDGSGREIVLSLSRLNRIREIDPLSNTLTAEAGVILENLHRAADEVDRLFPLSLASQGSAQIGGNLSSNAGGTGVLAYGNARELCLGVEVVLPTGEIFDDLRKLKKDNTGYDLKNLFVGAEGTLGVITAAVLKLFPKPKGREVAWVGINTPRDALALFSLASDRAGSGLTAFELMSETLLGFAETHIPGTQRPLADKWPWYVLMEIASGRSAQDARGLAEDILSAGLESGTCGRCGDCRELGAGRCLLGDPRGAVGRAAAGRRLDQARHIGARRRHPRLHRTRRQSGGRGLAGCPRRLFGHMGDGNLHYNISQPAGGDAKAFLALYRTMNGAVHDVVRALGGSISAEHGIGQLKRDELLTFAPPTAIDLMRRVKAAFDPAGIMNPGKVI